MIRWLAALTVDYVLIALAFSAVAHFGWPAVPIAMVIIGNRQHAIAVLGHDGAHGSISANAVLNDALTKGLCFWPLLVDLGAYRRFHFAHHKWLNNPERDPEIAAKRLVAPYSADATTFQVVVDCILVASWREVWALFKIVGRPPVIGPLWVFALWAAVLPWWALLLWLASLATTFWIFFRARVWTEHVFTGTSNWTAKLWQRALFAPHNIWVHPEHHGRPRVPYYDLPGLRNNRG